MKWETGIPGKQGMDWDGGVYKVSLEFLEEYPSKPPKCNFVPPLFCPFILQFNRVEFQNETSQLEMDQWWKIDHRRKIDECVDYGADVEAAGVSYHQWGLSDKNT